MNHVLLVRADGNSEIGLGHIMRSMTIANTFRNAGFECIFISSAPITREVFNRYGFPVIEIKYPYNDKTREEAQEISDIIHERCAKYILVDSYFINNEYLNILKESTELICINSTRNKLTADYLINENIACNRAYLETLYSESGTKLLLGPEYSLIREEFCGRSYNVKESVKRVLITTGGGDQYNFMTYFLKLLKEKNKYSGMEFLFISGGCNIHYNDLLKESAGLENVKIISNADNMAELMQKSDIAISTGGTTVLELSVIGVPTIGIAVADDQEAGLEYMDHIGMIYYAGCITDTGFWKKVLRQFSDILTDIEIREKLSNTARKYIDGKGAERIYHQIIGR